MTTYDSNSWYGWIRIRRASLNVEQLDILIGDIDQLKEYLKGMI
jgi:hypothetical protein